MESTQEDDQQPNQPVSAGWQILGELELPAAASADDVIDRWLTEVLSPLNLHAEFRNKILKSAQEAAAHGFQAEGELKLEHLHLIILVPQERESKGRNWGFFRIEKIEELTEYDPAPAHTIEFHLYLEGG